MFSPPFIVGINLWGFLGLVALTFNLEIAGGTTVFVTVFACTGICKDGRFVKSKILSVFSHKFCKYLELNPNSSSETDLHWRFFGSVFKSFSFSKPQLSTKWRLRFGSNPKIRCGFHFKRTIQISETNERRSKTKIFRRHIYERCFTTPRVLSRIITEPWFNKILRNAELNPNYK